MRIRRFLRTAGVRLPTKVRLIADEGGCLFYCGHQAIPPAFGRRRNSATFRLIALAGQRADEFSNRGEVLSMEPGGQGSFQAVKLQRPARATVCSHSTRDMAAKVPSNPNESIAMLIAGVCPVVYRCGAPVLLTSWLWGKRATHFRTSRSASSDLGGSRWTLY